MVERSTLPETAKIKTVHCQSGTAWWWWGLNVRSCQLIRQQPTTRILLQTQDKRKTQDATRTHGLWKPCLQDLSVSVSIFPRTGTPLTLVHFLAGSSSKRPKIGHSRACARRITDLDSPPAHKIASGGWSFFMPSQVCRSWKGMVPNEALMETKRRHSLLRLRGLVVVLSPCRAARRKAIEVQSGAVLGLKNVRYVRY